MENGFASPRTEAFPAGLRVLVVDDDAAWLKILEKMLKKCSYEVTTCFLAREALNMLRERKDGFDIVISDVNMPDMDGFKLLEHVGLEMDLPVIMMSVDGETSRVMKGVQHGACDYLLKPVRMKELKNIWQHVFRKKIHEVKDSESFEASEDSQVTRNGSEKFDDGNFLGGGDLNSVKKRKEMENKDHDDQDFNDPSAVKRARVVWSVDLHQKFVNAVDQIGLDKVGPKKILDLMNVPWLTRENVASHLQKYRMYLSRLQKQNGPKASFGGMKQPDFIPRDPPVSFGLQCSAIVHQENSTRCNFEYSGGKLMVQDVSSDFDEGDLKNIVSFSPRTEQRKALTGDLHQKRSSGSRMGHGHSLGSLGLDVNYTSFETTVPQHHSWNKEVPMMQFTQTPKREHEPHAHTHLPQSGPPIHIQSNCLGLTPSVPHGTCLTEKDTMSPSEAKILSTEYRNNHVRNISPTGLAIGSFSARPETEILLKGFGPNTTITGSSSTKNQSVDQKGISTWEPACAETEILNLQGFGPNTTITRSSSTVTGSSSTINQSSDQKGVSTWESAPGKLLPGCGSTLQSPQEVLQLCALQDYDSIESTGLNNVEYLDYHDLELFTAFPGQSYDRLRLNCDYLGDSMDYPILDQGLFIA